jgi:hypothetical protein
MTNTNPPETALHHAYTWLDVSASYGRERAQLLAVDGKPSRNAQIAEANNQQAHALKLAEIHATLAVAEGIGKLVQLAETWATTPSRATLPSYGGGILPPPADGRY